LSCGAEVVISGLSVFVPAGALRQHGCVRGCERRAPRFTLEAPRRRRGIGCFLRHALEAAFVHRPIEPAHFLQSELADAVRANLRRELIQPSVHLTAFILPPRRYSAIDTRPSRSNSRHIRILSPTER